MKSSAYQCRLAILIVPCLLIGGCKYVPEQKPVFPVNGMVLFDGKPVPYASVTFVPVGAADEGNERPSAVADRTGKFSLTTYTRNDGAPAGNYVVVVEARKQVVKNGDSDFGDNYLPTKYSDPATSDLKVQVNPGSNELAPFKLQR